MAALTIFPSSIKVVIYRRLFGFEIAEGVYIGFSLILCERLVLGRGAIIGHMNVIRGNMALNMGPGSSIGQFNWITAGEADARYFRDCNRRSQLILGEESNITSRHMLDCTDTIAIGQFTTIAGYRTTILTHGIDYQTSRQKCQAVGIGDFCLVGSQVAILMGVTVANRSIIGAGAVVASSIEKELGVWVGAPARLARELTGAEAYFTRQTGHVY